MLYSNAPINQLPEFFVQPRWGTALLDAMGKFITDVGDQLAHTPEDNRPGKVICLIMTDGMENSSKEWSLDGVKTLVEQQREQWRWEFIFMGANMDAVDVAASMGISRGGALTYNAADSGAVMDSYAVASAGMSSMRAGGQSVSFSEEDRAKAMGKKPKKAKSSS
jgi:hypothetical protein